MVALLLSAIVMILSVAVHLYDGRHVEYTQPNIHKYHKVGLNLIMDDISPSECNASMCIEHFANRTRFGDVAHHFMDQQQREIRQYMIVPFVVRNYLDLVDWMAFCEKPAEIMQSAIVFFKLANNQFQSRRSTARNYHAHLLSVYNTLFEQLGFSKETNSQLNNLVSISAERSDMYTILECYIISQPRFTNTSGSACFNLVLFYQRTFEFQQHLRVILGALKNTINENERNETKVTISEAEIKLRDLQRRQAEHMAMLCKRKNSYVIAKWSDRRPTAMGFSDKESKCFREMEAGTVRLENVNGKLIVLCSYIQVRQYILHREDMKKERETKRHNYYYSTRAVSVKRIFREYICEVSIGQRHIAGHQHYLVYLIAKVCHIGNATEYRNISGFTHHSHLHEKLEFPITYNPGRVSLHHPTPSHITSMGLYRDEVGRLSINISTSVTPNFA